MASRMMHASAVDMDIEEQEIHEYLLQVEKLRQECEQRGDFRRAQECVNRMREINFRQAKRLEAMSKMTNVDAKGRITDEQRLELLNFESMWEERLRRFDSDAEAALAKLKASHVEDYAHREGMLRVQLTNKRPRFSRTVVELRASLERCVQRRQYLEADDLKQRLKVLEEKELATFDSDLSATFTRKAEALKRQYVNEHRAAEQKVQASRDELMTQQRHDLQRLLKRHANAVKDLDTETKLHVSRTKKVLERQVTALANDPVKMGVDFSTIGRSVRARLVASHDQTRGAAVASSSVARSRAATAATEESFASETTFRSAATADDDRYMW